jgi:hypothetical protein
MRLGKETFLEMGNRKVPGAEPGTLQPLRSVVTELEIGHLIAYTGGLYGALNKWMRGDKANIPELFKTITDHEWSQISRCLASGLNKLGRYQGAFKQLVAFRGTTLASRTVKERYEDKKGSLITERGFQSYSFDNLVAIQYTGQGQDPQKKSVLFVLKGAGVVGASLEVLSSFDEEKELLVNSDHKYCVADVVEKTVGDIVGAQASNAQNPLFGSLLKEAKLTVVTLLIGAASCPN